MGRQHGEPEPKERMFVRSLMVLGTVAMWCVGGWGGARAKKRDSQPADEKPAKGRVGPRKNGKQPPFYARRLLIVDLLYKRGKLVQKKVRVKILPKKKRFRRYAGRFVARLLRNKKTIERVPFDFPLLGVAATFTKTGKKINRRIEAGLESRTRLRLPWDTPAEKVVVFDRKRKKTVEINLAVLKKYPMTRRAPCRGKPRKTERSRKGNR